MRSVRPEYIRLSREGIVTVHEASMPQSNIDRSAASPVSARMRSQLG